MRTKNRLKRVALAVAAMLLAAIGIVSCNSGQACAASGIVTPRPAPAPAPRAPSFSKPSAPRPSAPRSTTGYRPRPSVPHTGTTNHYHGGTSIWVFEDDDDCS